MVDIHTHLLHNVDDGASDLDVSINMLKQMSQIGVRSVVCTPHFNSAQYTVDEFSQIVQERIDELKPHASEFGISLIKGSEIYLTENMLSLNNVTGLLIEGTRNVLVEFPSSKVLTREDLNLLVNFSDYYNVRPIIAHAERYYSVIKHYKFAEKFLAMGAYIQVDAASFFDKRYKKTARALVKSGFASFIASDCHGDELRSPIVLRDAYNEIQRLYRADTVEEFICNSEAVVNTFEPQI